MSNATLVTDIVVDEVALEGMDGLTIESFWVRLAERLHWDLPFHDRVKTPIWRFIVRQDFFEFYCLEQPRPLIRRFNRYDIEMPHWKNTDECPYTVYALNEIEQDGGKLRGSCQDFNTRVQVPQAELMGMTLAEAMDKWGDKLIVAGNQEIREAVLIPKNIARNIPLQLNQYCMLERLGRSRFNGESTVGTFGINDKNTFHIRKTLIQHKMVCKQFYTEKVGDGWAHGRLLHLPRFFRLHKNKQMVLTEQVITILKSQRNFLLEYSKLHTFFDESECMTLRRLYKTHHFMQLVETDMKVAYREVYPDAKPDQYMSRSTGKELSLRVMQLRDPNIAIDEIWLRDEHDDADGGSDDDSSLLDLSGRRLDLSVVQQTHVELDAAGPVGLTQKELGMRLGLSKLNMRAVVRHLMRMDLIGTYMMDKGRQRLSMFISNQFKDKVKESFNKELSKRFVIDADKLDADVIIPEPPPLLNTSSLEQKLASEDAPINEVDLEAAFGPLNSTVIPPIPSNRTEADNMLYKSIVVEVKRFDKPLLPMNRAAPTDSTITVRMAMRLQLIEQALQAQPVIDDVSKIFHIVQQEERRLDTHSGLCRRSVRRLISMLQAQKKLCLWHIQLALKTVQKQKLYVCLPHVDPSTALMRTLIEKDKFAFMQHVTSERSRLKQLKATPPAAAATTTVPVEPKAKPGDEKTKRKKVRDWSYGCTAKFHKNRSLHEFLFYLGYTRPEEMSVIPPEQAFECWRHKEHGLDFAELLPELSPIYSTEMDWRMFVPPLVRAPPFVEDGWLLLSDVLVRMPLAVYVTLNNFYTEVPGLEALLSHPIRKNYLLSHLPATVQEHLKSAQGKSNALMEVIRLSCSQGLLQLGPQRVHDKDHKYLFVNRNLSILDTVDSAPGYLKTAKQEYPVVRMRLDTAEDLHKYWCTLHSVCMKTPLGKRGTSEFESLRWECKPELMATWRVRSHAEVLASDTGRIPGNGRGAAGLDSAIFAHLRRNWSYQSNRVKKKPKVRPVAKKSITMLQLLKRRGSTADKVGAGGGGGVEAGRNRVIVPVKRLAKRSPVKRIHIVRPVKKAATARRRTQVYDDVDKQALRQMVKLRVGWNAAEDHLLLLCRAAMTILCPNSRKMFVSSQQIRDILHWDQKSFDKTSRACQRRIVYMLHDEKIARALHMQVQEILENAAIRKRFSTGLYEQLRKQFPDEADMRNALNVLFVELVFLLRNKYAAKRKGDAAAAAAAAEEPEAHEEGRRYEPLLPDSVAAFRQAYHMKVADYRHQRLRYGRPNTGTDIEVNVVAGLIHSSCCCMRDKTTWNIQMYEVYKRYTERVLNQAMTFVRDNQLISANKLVNASKLCTRNLPLSTVPYHLSATYMFSMLTPLPVGLLDCVYGVYKNIIEHARANTELPLRRINGGCVMVLAELLHHQPRNIRIAITIPDSILVLDKTKKTDDSPGLGRIQKRFRGVFNYVQQDNAIKLQSNQALAQPNEPEPAEEKDRVATMLAKRRARRVTISTSEHQTLEYTVGAVENLMKQDDTMFHFYCALDALGRRTSLAQLTVDAEDHLCSLNCVLRKKNTVAAAVEVIRRHADVIDKIREEDQMELRMINGEFEISIWNVLSVFNVLVNKRYGIDAELSMEEEEASDHGMTKLSLEILHEELQQEERSAEDEPDALGDDDALRDDDIEPKMVKMQDAMLLNPFRLTVSTNDASQMIAIDVEAKEALLKSITSDCIYKTEFVCEDDLRTAIELEPTFGATEKRLALDVLHFVRGKDELGATNVELIAEFRDRRILAQCIEAMVRLRVVLKAGIDEITYVHWMFTKAWLVDTYNMKRLQRESIAPVAYQLMQVDETPNEPSTSKRKHSEAAVDDDTASEAPPKKSLRPNRFAKVTIAQSDDLPTQSQLTTKNFFKLTIRPWIRINGSLNRRVLDRWMGVIICYCVSNPSVTLDKLVRRFNLLVPVHIRDLVGYMQTLDLVELMTMTQPQETSIWSTYEAPEICVATDLDPMHLVYVQVRADAISKLALFVGEKQYKTEFIRLGGDQSEPGPFN